MKPWIAAAVSAATLVLSSVSAHASTPLTLDYSITPSGGLFDYQFTLTLDNNDASWTPGQTWNWIIFGDRSPGYPSPSGFCPNSSECPQNALFTPPPGFTATSSEGYSQGPTLAYGGDVAGPGWQPSGVGDAITWSYTSQYNLGATLTFSSLVTTGGAQLFEFEPGHLIATAAVPEPATWTMLILGLGMIGFVARRRNPAVSVAT